MDTKAFIGGIAATLAAIGLGAYGVAAAGFMPANADATPSKAERWFAMTALDAVIHRQASTRPNPVAPTDANIIAGVRLYKQNCAVCHGGADGQPSTIARGLYQHPPQLARHGVEDDSAGEIYWKIQHGIRLTGMPAYAKTLTSTQKWQITLFLQRMDRLPPAAQRIWGA